MLFSNVSTFQTVYIEKIFEILSNIYRDRIDGYTTCKTLSTLKPSLSLVQREDSLIKPRQSQNRTSGFSTDSVLKPLILFCDWRYSVLKPLVLFCDWRGLIKESSR